MPTLHIVMPVYNEGPTLGACLDRVLAAKLPEHWGRAVHVVDDCSAEPAGAQARELVERLQEQGHSFSFQRHEVNQGKGAAIRTGFDSILGSDAPDEDVMIIQDADLEYDPDEFGDLLAPIIAGRVRVVIGTRFGAHNRPPGVVLKLHAMGNRFLSVVSNLMTGVPAQGHRVLLQGDPNRSAAADATAAHGKSIRD